MSWARASSMSFFTLGTVLMQRGRTPQLAFMKSRTSRAVVFGSTVTVLSCGIGGGFTLAHSVVMSLAKAALSVPIPAEIATIQEIFVTCFMVVLSLDISRARGSRPDHIGRRARSIAFLVWRSLRVLLQRGRTNFRLLM